MARERRYYGLLGVLFWGAMVMLAALVADCLYVMWPYPQGALGVEPFHARVNEEWGNLVRLCGTRLVPLSQAIHHGLHTVLFRWPGFDFMIARAGDPTPLDSGGEMMRKAVSQTRPLWGTALVGLQLFSARLGVIVLEAPLLLLVSSAALADGMVGWYRRRSGSGRESGFVYHRAKRHAGHAVVLLAFAYLVPPAFVDPRMVITAAAIVLAVTIRIAAAHFKKFI